MCEFEILNFKSSATEKFYFMMYMFLTKVLMLTGISEEPQNVSQDVGRNVSSLSVCFTCGMLVSITVLMPS